MQKWEYDGFIWWGSASFGYEYCPRASDIEQFGDNPIHIGSVFDEKGDDGWELVQIIQENADHAGAHPNYTTRWKAYFKKPKIVV